MHCIWLILMTRKHLNPAILNLNLSKHWYFQISQNLFWMETDTQKSTKLHIQPGNHRFLKIYQPIYIDHIDALHYVDLYGKKDLNAAILKSNLSKLRYF